MSENKTGGTKVPGWTSEIGDRISWAIDALGGLRRAAEIAGTSDETLANWRDGKTRPTFFGLLALAQAAGRDLNWIATGEPPRDLGGQSALIESAPLDTQRLEDAVAIVDEWLVANRRLMPPDRKAKVVAMAYEILVESGASSGDDATRNNVIRLLRVAS